MNPSKLAFLINDTIDAIEKSKLGGLHCTDKDGNILRDANGFPFYNSVATQAFQVCLQAQILKASVYES